MEASVEELTGPFYGSVALAGWLAIDVDELERRAAAGEVLAARLDDPAGTWVFPTWQFTDERTVIAGLGELWAILRGAAEPWTAMLWLRGSNEDLDDATAVDWLTAAGDLAPAERSAREDAARWSQ